jgi:hypothetical protein
LTFKKGDKIKGKGQPRVPDDVRGARLLNQRDVELIMNKHLEKSAQELVDYTQDLRNPAKEILIARIIVEAIKHGDHNRLQFVLDRLLGKPKEQVEHSIKLSYHNEIMHMIRDAEADDIIDVTNNTKK